MVWPHTESSVLAAFASGRSFGPACPAVAGREKMIMTRTPLATPLALATTLGLAATVASAQVISEFQPNPLGNDADTPQTFEIAGTPGESFSGFIASIENDETGTLGEIQDLAPISGTFGTNGLFTAVIPDLENPSFTVALLGDDATATVGLDLDADNDGVADQNIGTLGTVFDALGVSDTDGDNGLLFGAQLGGTNLLFTGVFEPEIAFRSGSTGEFFQVVTDINGTFDDATDDVVRVFDAAGNELSLDSFDGDVTVTSFGQVNPVIPEPATLGLVAAAGLGLVRRRAA